MAGSKGGGRENLPRPLRPPASLPPVAVAEKKALLRCDPTGVTIAAPTATIDVLAFLLD